MDANISSRAVNAIRFLAIDAVQQARSGHPGAPMGMAPMAYVLWHSFLKHNPANPNWRNRDRFILSAGHASMLLYALLHLTGYDMPIDELKNFRQWGSRTAGHPEYGLAPGIETTTGPLGQGLANGVGMALAERVTAARYNTPELKIVDHNVYVLASDGDMEEGVAAEAASLAGTLKLEKLICLYDDNDISIDGSTDLHLAEDVAARYRAYGWRVLDSVDGNDTNAIATALKQAQTRVGKPTLIPVQTVIGYGSPNKAGLSASHGAPLGVEEVELSRTNLDWEYPPFEVPDDVYQHFQEVLPKGATAEDEWNKLAQSYKTQHPDLWNQLQKELNDEIDHKQIEATLAQAQKQFKPSQATRASSGVVINALADVLPNLIGGSADLAASNLTRLHDEGDFTVDNPTGRNIHFGIREHAMGAISNGMSLYGGLIPYAATFLIFSDYMRPAIRLSALSHSRVIWIFTHDSIGLGEDGPTHQPISQLMSLRMIPNLRVFRPADGTEVSVAWRLALQSRTTPSLFALSRHNLPSLTSIGVSEESLKNAYKGGYIVYGNATTQPDLILLATGSEVAPAVQSAMELEQTGVNVRVVSMLCWELFAEQDANYQDSVLPPNVDKRVSIEAGCTLGWERYVGREGLTIGIDSFGASAPTDVLMDKFGFTVSKLVPRIKTFLDR